MTTLEIRICLYAIALLGLIGATVHLTAAHYRGLMAEERVAADKALAAANQHTVDVTAQYQANSDQVEREHAALQAANTKLADSFAASVRAFATSGGGHLPQVPDPAAGNHGTGPGADSLGELTELARNAHASCLHDAGEVILSQEWLRAQQAVH